MAEVKPADCPAVKALESPLFPKSGHEWYTTDGPGVRTESVACEFCTETCNHDGEWVEFLGGVHCEYCGCEDLNFDDSESESDSEPPSAKRSRVDY